MRWNLNTVNILRYLGELRANRNIWPIYNNIYIYKLIINKQKKTCYTQF